MKKMTLKLLSALISLALLAPALSGCGDSGTSAADGKTIIKVGTSGGPAPYISLDENEKPVGYDVAVLEAVFEKLPQYELEWNVTSDYQTAVLSGILDLACNNLAYRPERAETFYYSYPYKLTDKVFIQRKGDEPLKDLADAASRGYRIQLSASGLLTSVIEKYNAENPDNQIPVEYIESAGGFVVTYQKIIDGEFDFTLDDSPIVKKIKDDYGLEDLAVYELTDAAMQEVMPSVYTYYLTAKDDKGLKLRDEINAALKELREDGTLERLSQEYFSSNVVPPLDQYESTLN